MAMKSNFEQDYNKEVLLGRYLDTLYPKLLPDFTIERIKDINKQHQGIDIIIRKDEDEFLIDEKAQLDYLNKSLPTFAFEISYVKNNSEVLGWLYDERKLTHKYFVITGIFLNDVHDITKGFSKCSVTSVDRVKLKDWLVTKGLTFGKIMQINNTIRQCVEEDRIPIPELDPVSEGKFYYSKSNKAEQPINLVLRLENLIRVGVAKKVS